MKKKSQVGHVYRGVTKYIDKDDKRTRNYVVVRDNGKAVSVAKLKGIKNPNDKALMPLNHTKYGLEKPTGVDYQRFSDNRLTGSPLKTSDKKVFPEGVSRFKLSSSDTHRAILHTTPKKKRGK